MVHVDPATKPVEQLEHTRSIRPRISPNPAEQVEVEAFVAAVGQVGTPTAAISHQAPEDTPEACPAREVEEDHGVCAVEALVVADAVVPEEVPVEDPVVAGDRCAELACGLLGRSARPAFAPEDPVEIDDSQPGLLRDLGREHAFARSAGAQDHDAFHLTR
jgi:hypothetical protein